MSLVGTEALARFRSPPARSPDQWFAEAEAIGLGAELELLAVEAAVSQRCQKVGGRQTRRHSLQGSSVLGRLWTIEISARSSCSQGSCRNVLRPTRTSRSCASC
jgi:EAL domain-containing protein (putative c-di-GMP-specific phosphodiesterase class I)